VLEVNELIWWRSAGRTSRLIGLEISEKDNNRAVPTGMRGQVERRASREVKSRELGCITKTALVGRDAVVRMGKPDARPQKQNDGHYRHHSGPTELRARSQDCTLIR